MAVCLENDLGLYGPAEEATDDSAVGWKEWLAER